MTKQERLEVDTEICREVIRKPHVHGHKVGFVAGETVNVTVAGEVVSATVEDRHLEEIRVFLASYPMSRDAVAIEHVSFRIAPADNPEAA